MTVIVSTWPGASRPSWQVTSPPAIVQVPSDDLASIGSSVSGMSSVTTTSSAVPGPSFLAVSVYVAVSPSGTTAAETAFLMLTLNGGLKPKSCVWSL